MLYGKIQDFFLGHIAQPCVAAVKVYVCHGMRLSFKVRWVQCHTALPSLRGGKKQRPAVFNYESYCAHCAGYYYFIMSTWGMSVVRQEREAVKLIWTTHTGLVVIVFNQESVRVLHAVSFSNSVCVIFPFTSLHSPKTRVLSEVETLNLAMFASVFVCVCVSSVMDRWPVRFVPCLSSCGCWDKPQISFLENCFKWLTAINKFSFCFLCG